MKVLRRLYSSLARYKMWAVVAFGSMLIFAGTQTAMVALSQPLFDVVLTAPELHEPPPTHVSREQAGRDRALNLILERDRPEGQRGWLPRTAGRNILVVTDWWAAKPCPDKVRVELGAIFILFVIRSVTSFSSEYAVQKVGHTTIRD